MFSNEMQWIFFMVLSVLMSSLIFWFSVPIWTHNVTLIALIAVLSSKSTFILAIGKLFLCSFNQSEIRHWSYHMLGFLEKSGIVVMLISGLETYAAIYTSETHPKYRPFWKEIEKEREDKVPNIPQMFLQTIWSTGNWKKKLLHDVFEWYRMWFVPLQPKNRTTPDRKHLVSPWGGGIHFSISETNFSSLLPPLNNVKHEGIAFGWPKAGGWKLLAAS